MKKVTQTYIRKSIKAGVAADVSKVPSVKLPKVKEILCYSAGSCGLNGYLYRGEDDRLYAIAGYYINLYHISSGGIYKNIQNE